MIGVCNHCGASFKRPPSGFRSDNLFCSKRCNAKHQASKRTIQTAEQFWSKVAIGKPEECWPWLGPTKEQGYGQSGWKGKAMLAHQIAMSLTDGGWESRLFVCHRCDNPPCCNPAHLWRGTPKDNAQDMVRKGRHRGAPKQTHCKNGHELNDVSRSKTGGGCMICNRERSLNRYYMRKAA